MEIARWKNHKFEVSSNKIQGIKGISIKGSSETENKTSSSQDYVSRKKGGPTEVSFTAILNAHTGCNVESEAKAFVEDARKGEKDYLYVSGKKLFTYQLMLTSANADQIEISSSGKWVKAEVQLTFKQTQAGSSSSSGKSTGSYGTSGSNKISVKSSNTVSPKTTTNVVKTAVKASTGIVKAATVVQKTTSAINAIKYGTTSQKVSAVKSAVSTVGKLITSAKNYSLTKKNITSTLSKLIKR